DTHTDGDLAAGDAEGQGIECQHAVLEAKSDDDIRERWSLAPADAPAMEIDVDVHVGQPTRGDGRSRDDAAARLGRPRYRHRRAQGADEAGDVIEVDEA